MLFHGKRRDKVVVVVVVVVIVVVVVVVVVVVPLFDQRGGIKALIPSKNKNPVRLNSSDSLKL